MKKNLFFAILALSFTVMTLSCSKKDTTPPPGTTAEGKWVGSLTYFLGPGHDFALTFKANQVVYVELNSAPEIANGTWNLSGDSVRATFTYVGTTDTYSIAGKYSASSRLMEGTIGPGTSTSGTGIFSVTKQ